MKWRTGKIKKVTNSLLAIFLLTTICSFDVRAADVEKLWQRFKENFYRSGAVIDPMNGNRVTSEAEGYTLYLAVKFNDKKTFDETLKWVINNLMVRDDSLLAWVYKDGKVMSKNNASDGDIFTAYALLLAYEKWKDTFYKNLALRMIEDIKKLIIPLKQFSLILPGEYGFLEGTYVKLSPAYYIPSAFRKFSEYDDKFFWESVYNDTYTFYSYVQFGRWKLPTDWIYFSLTEKKFFPADEKLGIEAYREVLYILMDKKNPEDSALLPFKSIVKLAREKGYLPFFVKPLSNEYSDWDALPGFYYVFSYLADDKTKESFRKKAIKLEEKDEKNYYSMVILLLTATIE